MSAVSQPTTNIAPAPRTVPPFHAALPDVQISFEALLAQTPKPTTSARTFVETGLVRANSIPAPRSTSGDTASVDAAPREVSPPALKTPPSPPILTEKNSARAPRPLHKPQYQAANSRAADRHGQNPIETRSTSPTITKPLRIGLDVGQATRGRDSVSGAALLQQFRSNAPLVAFNETTSGVRVLARVANLTEPARGRLRQKLQALLAQHGIHSANIEVE